MDSRDTITTQLQSLVGASAVVAWESLTEADRRCLGGAIAPNRTPPACVVSPASVDMLQTVVECTHRNRWAIMPWGQGSKISWGPGVQPLDVVISTAHLQQWVDHAVGDLTLTAETGLTLAAVQAQLGQHQQFIALDPLYDGSLGGLVATADGGSLRQRYGGVRDMVLGLEFVRSDGEKAKAGGRVVKNVAGYDLMKLFTGSQGSLGILTQITLRLYPLPESWQTVVLTGSAAIVAEATQQVLRSTLTPIALDLWSPGVVAALGLAAGGTTVAPLGLAIRFGTLGVSAQEQGQQVQALGDRLGLAAHCFTAEPEQQLWTTLRTLFQSVPGSSPAVLCKVGVLPTQAVATLQHLGSTGPADALGLIHGGSGLGRLRFPGEIPSPGVLESLRHHCQTHQGFVSILEAPPSLKEQLDLWGYGGNALGIMAGLKQQFDPLHLLSPNRFVGG
ncbi:FAD-binding oxidoreductase [Prochlorothrix hollandica]|uniref:FAD-binding oxidoreductase n=1 Tax=Prochlorothrix hollandica TaxID=1223 RepID=UPI003341C23C